MTDFHVNEFYFDLDNPERRPKVTSDHFTADWLANVIFEKSAQVRKLLIREVDFGEFTLHTYGAVVSDAAREKIDQYRMIGQRFTYTA